MVKWIYCNFKCTHIYQVFSIHARDTSKWFLVWKCRNNKFRRKWLIAKLTHVHNATLLLKNTNSQIFWQLIIPYWQVSLIILSSSCTIELANTWPVFLQPPLHFYIDYSSININIVSFIKILICIVWLGHSNCIRYIIILNKLCNPEITFEHLLYCIMVGLHLSYHTPDEATYDYDITVNQYTSVNH